MRVVISQRDQEKQVQHSQELIENSLKVLISILEWHAIPYYYLSYILYH